MHLKYLATYFLNTCIFLNIYTPYTAKIPVLFSSSFVFPCHNVSLECRVESCTIVRDLLCSE